MVARAPVVRTVEGVHRHAVGDVLGGKDVVGLRPGLRGRRANGSEGHDIAAVAAAPLRHDLAKAQRLHPVEGCLEMQCLAFVPDRSRMGAPAWVDGPVASGNDAALAADQARQIRDQPVDRADALSATRRARLAREGVVRGGHGDDDKRLVSVDRVHYRGSERAPLARVEVVAEVIAHRQSRDEADGDPVGKPGHNRGIAQGGVVASGQSLWSTSTS